MQIVIDQGNTFIKVAIFDKDEIISVNRYDVLDKSLIDEIAGKYSITHGIISSVGDRSKIHTDAFSNHGIKIIELSSKTPLPIGNNYSTPQTLGVDRLALAVGANSLSPNQNLLVVDMGTCITADHVGSSNAFEGGVISPGMMMRFKAMHEHTARLPLLSPPESSIPVIGKSTVEAMSSGVMNGMVLELEGYRKRIEEENGKVLLYLTGGDAKYFQQQFKDNFVYEPNLLFIGLKKILDHNSERI